MADETKTQIPKPTRQRGPMGRMGGMRRGEKAKDFKGTMRQLLGYICLLYTSPSPRDSA